jgi:hypothetical protein
VTAEPVSTCVHEILHFSSQILFCYKIENATFTFFVSWIPVLYGRIFDFGIVKATIPLLRHAAGFRHDSVRAAFKVTYVTSFICN